MPYNNDSDTLELIENRLSNLADEALTVGPELREAMLFAQPLLAEEWLSPEEEEAWARL